MRLSHQKTLKMRKNETDAGATAIVGGGPAFAYPLGIVTLGSTKRNQPAMAVSADEENQRKKKRAKCDSEDDHQFAVIDNGLVRSFAWYLNSFGAQLSDSYHSFSFSVSLNRKPSFWLMHRLGKEVSCPTTTRLDLALAKSL